MAQQTPGCVGGGLHGLPQLPLRQGGDEVGRKGVPSLRKVDEVDQPSLMRLEGRESRTRSPGHSSESNPGSDWPHACTSPSGDPAPFCFQHLEPQTGWEAQDDQHSLGSGLKSYRCQLYFLKNSGSVQFNTEMPLTSPPPAPMR